MYKKTDGPPLPSLKGVTPGKNLWRIQKGSSGGIAELTSAGIPEGMIAKISEGSSVPP